MTVIGVRSPQDAMLGKVAPLALAASARTALMVDGDPSAPPYDTPGSLAQLVADGPRRSDLVPSGRGVAVLANGGVTLDEAADLLDALSAGWSHVVVRMPVTGGSVGFPTVSVLPLLPGTAVRCEGPVVYQRGPWSGGIRDGRPPGLVVPRPSSVTVRRLLCGRAPGPSRWIRAWRAVWSEPWM